ncbi:hypothetical protein BCR33DRAFT_451959 [Rhizoclosmatium globosum]|uniref:G-protein coupled receptors family 3 profile domain-containing protein n=1 Tax=Rhizoclosmatium globosum TaxID=329046 RepID=A0A1Y2CWT5_9FUNG|nr:hypothetical protein BCR33DRAFT_451959 [Rhizoclosmatium globosum]|eukprot:ORY51304.1 hypothetical protein BCR33DRAFT_451959 [Rhizoclosmatium globosum]
MDGSMYLYLDDITDYKCNVREMLFSAGYAIILISLTSKNALLIRLFDPVKPSRISVLRNGFRFFTGLTLQFEAVRSSFSTVYTIRCEKTLAIDFQYKSIALGAYNGLIFIAFLVTVFKLKRVWSQHNDASKHALLAVVALLVLVITKTLSSQSDKNIDFKLCICLWLFGTFVLILTVGSKATKVMSQQRKASKVKFQRASFVVSLTNNVSAKPEVDLLVQSNSSLFKGRIRYEYKELTTTVELCTFRHSKNDWNTFSEWFIGFATIHSLGGRKRWLSLSRSQETQCFVLESNSSLSQKGHSLCFLQGSQTLLEMEFRNESEAAAFLKEFETSLETVVREAQKPKSFDASISGKSTPRARSFFLQDAIKRDVGL